MSISQCEECRLALVRVVFDPEVGEGDAWGCQLDDTFSQQTREVECPFYVGWEQALPPAARSCKKSKGAIDGCSTGSCGSCGGSCGSGGCGVDPVAALEAKWDPELDVEGEAGFHDAAIELWRTAPDRPEDAVEDLEHERHHRHEHEHDHDHPHGEERVGEGPTEGDTRHRPGGRGTDLTPEPAPAVAPGVRGDPQVPDGRADEPADDGFPTEGIGQGTHRQAAAHDHAHGESCGSACGAMKALERMGLGTDESAPVPIPLDD